MSEIAAEPTPQPFYSGFVCFVGRPNAGKSTLTNALIGQKVAITSSKPQTTRHAVRGIMTSPNAQLVVIDTPGVSRPRSLLQERLNDLVYQTWAEVDVIALTLPANQHIGPGDQFLVQQIAKLPHRPTLVAVATKTDTVSKERLRKHLIEISELSHLGIEWADIVPCSALTGDQVDDVAAVLIGHLEPGPAWYPDGEISDEPTETLVGELIREAALEQVRDELPHSIAVEIDEMGVRPGTHPDQQTLQIFASIVVERDSQKGIMIGHKGVTIKKVGTQARRQIQALLGTRARLDLKVKVLKDWQKNPKYLNRLGF